MYVQNQFLVRPFIRLVKPKCIKPSAVHSINNAPRVEFYPGGSIVILIIDMRRNKNNRL